MAPFTISTPHPSPHQGCLPPKPLFIQSEMSLSSRKHQDLCVIDHLKASVMRTKLHLWQAVNTVQNFCTSVTQLLKSKTLFFICVGRKIVAMMGILKKSGAEALERPETRDEERDMSHLEIDFEEEERESSGNDDAEWKSAEETEDEEGDEETEEEDEATDDSDWSDDDDDDSEASAESLEIWESFLNNGDPYNPLSFCSSVGSRTNTQQKQQIQTQPPAETGLQESPAKAQTKNGGKKVCFSEQVCVRPLLVWSFASRSARDGSCWLQMARDRERFRRRVQTLEPVLKPCLMPEHRARVWERLRIDTAS